MSDIDSSVDQSDLQRCQSFRGYDGFVHELIANFLLEIDGLQRAKPLRRKPLNQLQVPSDCCHVNGIHLVRLLFKAVRCPEVDVPVSVKGNSFRVISFLESILERVCSPVTCVAN